MKISVITTTYNSGGTVRDTLESVLRQTHHDIEMIVIDGASHDDTMAIVREYEGKFGGRMRCVSERDRGIYDAMNKGIAIATGDVVGMLNSDDFYTSDDVLERVADRLSRGDIDAVYGDIHYVDAGDLSKCVRHYSSRPFRRWMMRLGLVFDDDGCGDELVERVCDVVARRAEERALGDCRVGADVYGRNVVAVHLGGKAGVVFHHPIGRVVDFG